jgi:predicted transposase YbfD/YdcC
MVRDTAGVLTLVDVETGAPRAMIPMRHKDEGPDGELTRAQELIDQLPDLSQQTLSGDALHTQKKTAKSIVEKGGDFIIQVKDNQPTLRAFAEKNSAT